MAEFAIKISEPWKASNCVREYGNCIKEEEVFVEIRGVSKFPHHVSFPNEAAAKAWIELAKRSIAVLMLGTQLGKTGDASTEDQWLAKMMGES